MYERLRLTTGGNIGINDSGPNFHLDVNGNIALREGQVLTWHDGSGNKAGDIYMDSSDNFVIRNTSSVTERLRIASDGAITVTSDGSDNDGANLTSKHANNNSTDTVSALIFSNNVGEVARIVGRTDGGNNNGGITFHRFCRNYWRKTSYRFKWSSLAQWRLGCPCQYVELYVHIAVPT